MLLPRAHNKFNQPEPPPELGTAEQRQESIEKDRALAIRARRRERENAVEAGQIANAVQRFELTRQKVIFGLELMLTVVGFAVLVVFLILNPASVPLGVSGGGGFGGLLLLLRQLRVSGSGSGPSPAGE